MKERDKAIDGDQGAHMPPLGTKNFRIVGDPDAHDHRALPGLYEVTFPVCEVKPVSHQFRLFARMAMRGPLECQVPRSLAYELDVTGTFATIRQEFRRLGIPLTDADSAEEACKALLLREEHVNIHRFVDGNANSALRYAIVTVENAKALLKGLLPPTQKLRIAASLFPPPGELKKDKWTPAVQKKMSREIIAWATILRCDASPLANAQGPMKPLFGNVFDSYDLVQLPVEPYASDPIARVGTYWLRATHCSFRQRNRFYYTHIRLEMVNEEISPTFRAVYELKRKLTYTQLCAEFRKLQVIIHSKAGLKPACKSVLGDIAYARCLPEDAPAWMGQNATLN